MRVTANLVLGLFALLAPAGVRAAAQAANPRAAIEATDAKLAAAFAKGDAAQVAALYTADGQVLPPHGEAAQGREAIQKVWQGAIDAGLKELTLTVVEVEGHGDMAHELGTYTLTAKDGKVADRGKYIVVWKKDKGQWRLHRDIWNTSMPPAPSKPTPAAPAPLPPAGKPAR